MLDAAKRKCHLCYEDQDKWGIPIPDCQNPDGDNVPCDFPKILVSLDPANSTAWELWSKFPEQLVHAEVSMAGAIYTLNLDSFRQLCQLMGISDIVGTYRKIRVIFEEWKRIGDAGEGKKTKKSMDRTRKLRAERGG